jgi:hypothetical protein
LVKQTQQSAPSRRELAGAKAMRADVKNLMGGELGTWLDSQSGMRAEAKDKSYWRWTWGAAVLMPVLALVWSVPVLPQDLQVAITAIGVIGVGVWGYGPIKEAKTAIKLGINAAIARNLGIEYDHEVESGPEFAAAKTYGLVPDYDRDSFEDRWSGMLEGHAFELYEAHLEERRGSGRNRRWVTVFRGAIIRMEFGRDFRSTTLLQRAGQHKSWFGLGGVKNDVDFNGHELAFVDQVHPEFADVFDLYSDDQVEARTLVHPAYVEHLLALEKAFHGDAVRALFAGGEVIVAVQQRENLFESGSIDPEKDRQLAEETADQFAALARLALSINQTERGRAVSGDAKPPDPPREEIVQPTKRRVAGGFGRKGI